MGAVPTINTTLMQVIGSAFLCDERTRGGNGPHDWPSSCDGFRPAQAIGNKPPVYSRTARKSPYDIRHVMSTGAPIRRRRSPPRRPAKPLYRPFSTWTVDQSQPARELDAAAELRASSTRQTTTARPLTARTSSTGLEELRLWVADEGISCRTGRGTGRLLTRCATTAGAQAAQAAQAARLVTRTVVDPRTPSTTPDTSPPSVQDP